jgi:hypothetical protein
MCVASSGGGGRGGGYSRGLSPDLAASALATPSATSVAPANTSLARFLPPGVDDLERQRRPLRPVGIPPTPRLGL